MSTPAPEELTTTSYAILGLLSLKPWTTYELAKQMQRSIHWFWPRAERKFYDEPKRLATLGLVSASTRMTGRRASTVYEITPAGREAVRAWVAVADFPPPALEMEGMLHLWFAEHGTPAQLTAGLRRTQEQATEALDSLCGVAESLVDGPDEFLDRRAMNAVTLELYIRLYETIRDWSVWAEDEVGAWPPARRQRRVVVSGPPERGTELYAAIAKRRPRI